MLAGSLREKSKRTQKLIVFVASLILIFVTSVLVPGSRSPDLVQFMIHDLGHLMILALALFLFLIAGIRDLGLAGYYFLSVALVRLVVSELYDGSNYFATLSAGLLISVGFAVFGVALGYLFEKKREHQWVLSLGFALLMAAIGSLILQAYETWTDPILGGRTPLPSFWLLLGLYSLCLIASVQAIRYFWPKFFFLAALIPIWVAMFLFHFVVVAYGGLPLSALSAVIAIFVLYFILHHTTLGRSLHAMGYNREAARLCGVRLSWVSMAVVAASLFLVSLASLLERHVYEAGSITKALQLHISAFAALIIGGVSLRGGRGCLSEAVVGVLFVIAWSRTTEAFGWTPSIYFAGLGVGLLGAVFLDREEA